MGSCRPAALAASASLLLAIAPLRPARGDDTEEAKRAEDLMTRLYADHGNEELLRQAAALREECLASGNYRTAEYVAGQIVNHRPASLAERHRFEQILLSRGKGEKAEEDLRQQIRERPSDCDAYWMLADLLGSTGRPRDAMEIHAAHLREHPGDAGALRARAALALYDLRDPPAFRETIAALRTAGSAPGTSPEVAAWIREQADRFEAEAAAEDRRRQVLRTREGLLDALLAGAAALFLAAGFAAFRATRGK